MTDARSPDNAGTANPSATDAEVDQQDLVITLMRENGHMSRQILRRRMKDLEVTSAEARALMYLSANQGIAQGALADLLSVQPIVLSKSIDRLEQAGLAERRPSETDRRLRLLFPTDAGKALVRKVLSIHRAFNREMMAAIPEQELSNLADSLRQMNKAIQTLK